MCCKWVFIFWISEKRKCYPHKITGNFLWEMAAVQVTVRCHSFYMKIRSFLYEAQAAGHWVLWMLREEDLGTCVCQRDSITSTAAQGQGAGVCTYTCQVCRQQGHKCREEVVFLVSQCPALWRITPLWLSEASQRGSCASSSSPGLTAFLGELLTARGLVQRCLLV